MTSDKMNSVCLDVNDIPEAVGLKAGDRVPAHMDLVLTRDVAGGQLYATIEAVEIEEPVGEPVAEEVPIRPARPSAMGALKGDSYSMA